MPRHYFHVIDGTMIKDSEGTECADAAAAIEHAKEVAAELAHNSAQYEGFAIRVVDDHGEEIARIPIEPTVGRRRVRD